MPAPIYAGNTITAKTGLSCQSPMAAKALAHAMGDGAIIPYTFANYNEAETNSCEHTLNWFTANVTFSQVYAAVTALRPVGLGPVTIGHSLNGTVTSATI
jgi:hypothetical protein